MIRFLAVAALLVYLLGPCGDVVVDAMEVGYMARESNTRLAVATAQASGGDRPGGGVRSPRRGAVGMKAERGTALFGLGRVVITPCALDTLTDAGVAPRKLVVRHISGDWGELDEHDRRVNETALKTGRRLLSSYPFGSEGGPTSKVWVITEADRSATTILLPEEY